MDTKQAYSSLIRELKAQLDAELPLAKEADDTLVAKQLLSSPSDAARLCTSSIEGYEDHLFKELAARSFRNGRYTKGLYSAEDETVLCDTIADLAFAQIQRKPVIRKAKPAGEYESAVAFVLGLYTVFAILDSDLTPQDFTRIHSHAVRNYYLNHGSRSIRCLYDPSWHAKYALRSIFYPLG
ncbi:MAG: hypothetical protein J5939_04375 [Bacteroidales bacterium]|nr:hypothetical protein [Bacteroidales bacterium]